jgi:hypothetical protein
MFKNYLFGFGGLILGILLAVFFSLNFSKTSDQLYGIGTIFNGIVLIVIATSLSRSQNNSKAIKDYFIQQLVQLRKDYLSFHDLLLDGCLKKSAITSGYKSNSMVIQQINLFLKKEMEIELNIQTLNRDCHFISCNHEEFDTKGNDDLIAIDLKRKVELEDKIKQINYLFTSTIISITKN